MVDVTHTPSPTAITKAEEIVAVYRYDIHPVTVPRITTAIALALDERDREVEADARRYRRLRVLGCAVLNTPQLRNGTVVRFSGLDQIVDDTTPQRAILTDTAPPSALPRSRAREATARERERWQPIETCPWQGRIALLSDPATPYSITRPAPKNKEGWGAEIRRVRALARISHWRPAIHTPTEEPSND